MTPKQVARHEKYLRQKDAQKVAQALKPLPPPPPFDPLRCLDRGRCRGSATVCCSPRSPLGVPCFDLRVIRHACPRLHGRR